MKTLHLPACELPVMGEYDVIVAGGGTAGALAGISSARNGLKTLIIEQFGCLGGSATMGMVTPHMPSYIADKPGYCPLGQEITRRMRDLGGMEESPTRFDPTMLKCVLEDMALESGVRLLYHTSAVQVVKRGECVTHVVTHNKDGLTAYASRYVIDCTGDADVAVLAGAKYEIGDHNGVNQPVSLRFEMAGVDFDSFQAFMEKLGSSSPKYFAMNTPGIGEILKQAHEDGILTKQDIGYFQAFGIPGKPDSMSFNCPELTTKRGVADAAFLTEKQIEGKKAILRLRRFLRERIPGFENAYISEIAGMVGLRDSRRVRAELTMTIGDVLAYRKFDDGIIACAYPLDVHGVEDATTGLGLGYDESLPASERYWEVPFRCMIPQNLDNMLVAGRCAGFDFLAQSAARIQLVCRAMGEAAGIGAALAAKGDLAFCEIDAAEVKRRLIAQGML